MNGHWFPPISINKEDSDPSSLKPWPSNDLNFIGKRLVSGETVALRKDKDMNEVKEPSSKTVRWNFFPMDFIDSGKLIDSRVLN